jgi:hypothetical protein
VTDYEQAAVLAGGLGVLESCIEAAGVDAGMRISVGSLRVRQPPLASGEGK